MTTWSSVSSSDAAWTDVDIEKRTWTWDDWSASQWGDLNTDGIIWTAVEQIWYTIVSSSDATWTVV